MDELDDAEQHEEGDAAPEGGGDATADGRRPRRWPYLLGAGVLVLIMAAGTLVRVTPTTAERFEEALAEAGEEPFTTAQSAERYATDLCAALGSGESEARGPQREAIAVGAYCPDFVDRFQVLEQIEVEGSFTIMSFTEWADDDPGMPCAGSGGYGDISSSTSVVVTDLGGEVLTADPWGRAR